MYYYLDNDRNFQGPYSESALAKWYKSDELPRGMTIYDHKQQGFLIEEIVGKTQKPPTKVIFDDTMILDKTIDQTNLDVTINMNNTFRPCDSTMFQPDFTQIDDDVDEVECGRRAENDRGFAKMQKAVGLYVVRRALHNARSRHPDAYVPFENSWSKWAPQPLAVNEALRACIHLRNRLQDVSRDLANKYLQSLNIFPHPCMQCHVNFDTSLEMICHFVGVVHVRRLYTYNPHALSLIDVECVEKIISEVSALEETRNVHLTPFEHHHVPSFFDDADVNAAFESLKSTIHVMQSVPLLHAPRDRSDVCEYVEGLVLIRMLGNRCARLTPAACTRRIGIERVHCAYCNVDFDGTHLDALLKHFFLERHVKNALRYGISRSDVEYWISFLRVISVQQNTRQAHPQNVECSLQEKDFPLCYELTDLVDGDFLYQGAEVERVLCDVRSRIRDNFELLREEKLATKCLWCNVKLYSVLGVLRHVLYDKSHTKRLHVISNDDLRRLLKWIGIPVTVPLFEQSRSYGRFNASMHEVEKRKAMQRLQNVAWRTHRNRAVAKIALRSFPMGLVNRCELCQTDLELVEDVLVHFCTESHARNVIINPRITESDVHCWLTIFNVGGSNSK